VTTLLGFIVGIVFGLLQIWALYKYTVLVVSKGISAKCILLGVLQFIMPFAVLVGVALLRRQDILWAGVGMSSCLVIGALIIFIKNRYKRGRDNCNG